MTIAMACKININNTFYDFYKKLQTKQSYKYNKLKI